MFIVSGAAYWLVLAIFRGENGCFYKKNCNFEEIALKH
jgi:hypothetical protein